MRENAMESIEMLYLNQEPEVRFILKWTKHWLTLLLASPLPVSRSDDTASC